MGEGGRVSEWGREGAVGLLGEVGSGRVSGGG